MRPGIITTKLLFRWAQAAVTGARDHPDHVLSVSAACLGDTLGRFAAQSEIVVAALFVALGSGASIPEAAQRLV